MIKSSFIQILQKISISHSKEVKEYQEFFQKNFLISVFAGNIGEAQSFKTIIEAINNIKELPVKLIVLGDGRYKETRLEFNKRKGVAVTF